VVQSDGIPAVGVPLGALLGCDDWYTLLGRTGEDGSYAFELPYPARFTVLNIHTEPTEVFVSPSSGPVDFEVLAPCSLEVTVSNPDDTPLEGAGVSLAYAEHPLATTDASGHAILPFVPCGSVDLQVVRNGELLLHYAGPAEEGKVALSILPSVLVSGTITSTEGNPIPYASVQLFGDGIPHYLLRTRADAQGDYAIHVPPGAGRLLLTVSPLGRPKVSASFTSSVSAGARVRQDLVVPASRTVTIGCAGLDRDLCTTVNLSDLDCKPASGTWPSPPSVIHEGACSMDERSGPLPRMICACPLGDAVLSGGGKKIRVPADAQWTWLDFRGSGGGVRGRLARPDGSPVVGCEVYVLEEVGPKITWLFSGPGPPIRRASTDTEGRFEILGVPDGPWLMVSHCEGMTKQTVEVSGQVVDLGEVAVGQAP
jgi:hypothetical protein